MSAKRVTSVTVGVYVGPVVDEGKSYGSPGEASTCMDVRMYVCMCVKSLKPKFLVQIIKIKSRQSRLATLTGAPAALEVRSYMSRHHDTRSTCAATSARSHFANSCGVLLHLASRVPSRF